jgi:hypothetical protein
MNINWIAVGLVSAALAACGGGGEGGGEACEHGSCTNTTGTTGTTGGTGGTTTTVTASVVITSTNSVTVSVPVNTATTLAAVTGTWSVTGATVTTLPCITLSDTAGYFNPIRLLATASSGTFSLVPDLPALTAVSGIIPGVLRGNLTVQAYSDANCTAPYSGGSATVPYTITVN